MNKIKNLDDLKAYKVLDKVFVNEINSDVITLEHTKTKARILVLPNEDNNKVFTIGFRTPSLDSTGAAHIVEHTVLCGSRKYPVKDPFIELVKGSLNTFLNAITFPDKTIYPVASCNDKDFQNLMDVYLDAVFFPNIYKEEKFFLQEGWHYELKDEKSPLTYSGVVYNEMKGVYSSGDGVLDSVLNKALYEGHSYGEDSGGEPKVIPSLTYEKFLDFHRKYYHPTNSFIYLYGDMDMYEKLEYIDREYLSLFEYLEIDSAIKDIKIWKETRNFEYEYSISEGESEENASYLSWSVLTDCAFDPIKNKAMKILEYILTGKTGAYIKEALIAAGIGEDISGDFDDSIKFPSFNVTAKNANVEQKAEFMTVIKGTLRKLANNGLNKEELLAAINVSEFREREADFGGYPRGLIYVMNIFHSWLYDEEPCMNIRFENVYKELREKIDTNYFEELINEYLLDNTHEAVITLKPVMGLAAKEDDKLKNLLEKKKNSLSDEEKAEFIKATVELEEFQDEKSTKEDLEKIPLLKREDIDRKANLPFWTEKKIKDVKTIHVDTFTSGISYIKLSFDVSTLTKEELPYLNFLKLVLKRVDTKNYTYSSLSILSNLYLGGIAFSLDCYSNSNDSSKTKYTFSTNIKVLYENTKKAFEIIKEILYFSKFEDKKRIKEIVGEAKATMKDSLLSAGHINALTRAASFAAKESYFRELTSGISFYKFLEKLYLDFENEVESLLFKLNDISKKIFTADNLILSVTSDENGFKLFEKSATDFVADMPETAIRGNGFVFEKVNGINEAFTSSSLINYVARYGDFKEHGFKYTGVLRILKNLLSYDYLWNLIRVKGNAYGCAAIFAKSGGSGFTSYRDPNISETYKAYENIPEYVKNFDADEREMTKSIIGAISELDTPLTPSMKGSRGFLAYMSEISNEEIQKERDEILDATSEDIRNLYSLVSSIFSDIYKVVIGNDKKIQEDVENDTKVESLYNE